MLEWMVKGQVIYVLIFMMSGIGFISNIITGIAYSSLVKASEDMAFTESSLLKQIKLKYANCFKLELYTNEVQAFINKYLFKKRILKCPLYFWEHMSLEMMYITMVLGLLGTFMQITYYQQNGISPFSNAFIIGIIGFSLATLLLVFRIIFALDTKKQIFYSNVIDYLENQLKNKLEQQYKKEDIYEMLNKMETMEKEKKENNPVNKRRQKSVQATRDGVATAESLSEYGTQQEKEPNEPVQENLIEEVINQLI